MTQEIIKSVADIQMMAEIALKSGAMGLTNSSQAVMKILAGQEMGLGVFASLSSIHIIKEKPVIGANLMAAKIKSSGKYDYKFIEFNKQVCELMFFERAGYDNSWTELGGSRFTIEDASTAGLLDKKNKDGSDNNWQKYPQNMLFARAISNGVKWYCPDLFSGNTVYTPGELDQAAVVEGEWTDAADGQQLSVNDLIERFGAAAVMEANGGQVPDDDPEALAALEEKLITEYTAL